MNYSKLYDVVFIKSILKSLLFFLNLNNGLDKVLFFSFNLQSWLK